MASKFSFPSVGTCSDVPKCKCFFWKIAVVLPPIFVADTKIIYGYNFVSPLKYCKLSKTKKKTFDFHPKIEQAIKKYLAIGFPGKFVIPQ